METVSRRTRGRLDAYYRNLHRSIKNPTNNKVEEKMNNNIIDHDEVEDDVVVDSESESESDDEEQHKKKKKTKTRLVGKKRVGGGAAGEIDFLSVLDIDTEREKKRKIKRENSSIIIGEDGDRGLALKFKFGDDDDDEGKSSASCLVGEKSEIDRLFDDLELGLWESSEAPLSLSHSDSCTTVLNDEEEETVEEEEEEEEEEEVEVEESRAGKCSRGEHLPYVDEEIGIICTSCLSLLLDIKYVLPPFCASASAFPSPSKPIPSSSSSSSSSSNIPSSFKQVEGGGGGGGRESGGGTVFDLIPPSDKDKDKDKELYPHQLEGFELLWRNIGGGIHLNNLPASNGGGSGCIISHAPGTGKTRLTIVFLQTFLKLHPTCRPLLIAPRGMLLTWHQELIKWNAPISFHNLNESTLSHEEEETALALDQHYHPYPKTLDYIRSIKIRSWIKGGSILGVAYRLFEELTRSHTFKKVLLEAPTLLILDEGHTPRNDHTLMWKVLTRVTTQRRIILSGTPFQNNFDELFNTLSLVNPTFSQQLQTQTRTQTQIGGGEASCRKRGRKRKNNNNAAREEWANLTNSITTGRGRGRGRGSGRNDDEGIKKLRALIQPFVHVHKGNILQQTLPGMKDCLIILKPTPLQQKLLDHNVAHLHNFLEQSHLASLISVHPSLVAQDPAFSHHKRKLKSLESDPKAGVKTHFLINLIDISSRINEKVLIFSEFIKPLLHIKKLLKSHFAYNEGRQVMYIDGDLSMKQRQSLITSFNDKNGEAKVLLASQRACCEGISLVGASRVVLLDVSWNPSVERQAICRAYRIGQEKMVYVYHLITLMEVKKYARQTEKDWISELIFSGAGAGAGAGAGEGEGEMRGCCRESVCQDKVLEAMVDHQGTMFERIVHQPKESDFIKDFGFGDLDFSTSMDFNDT